MTTLSSDYPSNSNIDNSNNQTSSILYYDEIEIEDLEYNSSEQQYTYPCPCGDTFRISLYDLYYGEPIANCPSCTLQILIIYEKEDLPEIEESEYSSNSEDE